MVVRGGGVVSGVRALLLVLRSLSLQARRRRRLTAL
jgi:hypothetical protein